MAYITTAELKSFLDITSSADDALLGIIIASAQEAIDNYTLRTFEPSGAQGGHHPHKFTPLPRRLGGDVDDENPRLLWLQDMDLSEIQSVVNGDGVTILSTEYITNPINHTPWYAIELKRGSSKVWTYTGNSPEGTIVITGKWCYALEAPADIKMAMYKLCKAWYNGRADSTGDRDILTTDGVVLVQSRIPSDVTAILSKYKRYS
jgi:hypothetical protein